MTSRHSPFSTFFVTCSRLSFFKSCKKLTIGGQINAGKNSHTHLDTLQFEPDVGLLAALLYRAGDHLLLGVLLQRESDLARLVRASERYHVVDHLKKEKKLLK